MKTFLALIFAAALGATSAFASDVPVFNATLTVGKDSRFVLIAPDGKASSFVQVGESFAGYTIKAYDAKTNTLDLEKDGKITRVGIAADAAVAKGAAITPATVADATAVLDAMNFADMMDKMMAGVKKQQAAMIDKMVGQMGGQMASASASDREEFVAFQKRVMDEMMSAMSGAEMKNDVAKAYSEVFTKEELQGLASFYSSPLGQTFSDKQPELMQKMNDVMMPRMMAVMPKIQKMGQEFAAQRRAKQQAAASAAAGSPAPAPSPSPAPVAPGGNP